MLKPGHTETLEERCVKKGMRMTEQRRVIAQVIEAADDHPDVEELYRRAAAIDPRISLSTVYRTLNLFEEAGLVTKHDFKDGRARFEPIPDEHHDHLIDIRSGKVIEFRNEEIEAIQDLIAKRLGYRLVDHRLELYAVPLKSETDHEMIFRTLFFIFIFAAASDRADPDPVRHHPARPVLERPDAAVPQGSAASSSACASTPSASRCTASRRCCSPTTSRGPTSSPSARSPT